VILLAGGPGASSINQENHAIRLINGFGGQVAAYTVDHRGLGSSGKFSIKGAILENTFETLSKAFSNGPFDIKDLIITNAALDVAMLGLAIRAEDPEARIVLRGFSYGAQWAHHVVQLTPNLFDSAFLGGLPQISGTDSEKSLIGLADVCAKDTFCRLKMGRDVYKAMNQAVQNLGNRHHNGCTEMFHAHLSTELTGTVGDRTRELSFILVDLLDRDSKTNTPQLLLPFLMATEKCVNPNEYNNMVLQPTIKYMRLISLKDSASGLRNSAGMDSVVNSAISFDIYCRDFPNGKPTPSANHADLHPDLYRPLHYYHVWEQMQPLLKERKLSQERPATTPRTAIYMMASRMDLNTTYMPAWSAFNLITAPTKKWLLFDNRSHDGYWGECCDMLEWEAITGKSTGFGYEECVHRTDKNYKLNWRLADPYTAMWDCVPNSNDLDVVSSTVPVFLEIGETGEHGLPDKAFHVSATLSRARPVHVDGEFFILVLVLILMKYIRSC
jgi:predicted esterase